MHTGPTIVPKKERDHLPDEPLSRLYFPQPASAVLPTVDEQSLRVQFEYGSMKHYETTAMLLGREILRRSGLEPGVSI
jgi:hypothetical protein